MERRTNAAPRLFVNLGFPWLHKLFISPSTNGRPVYARASASFFCAFGELLCWCGSSTCLQCNARRVCAIDVGELVQGGGVHYNKLPCLSISQISYISLRPPYRHESRLVGKWKVEAKTNTKVSAGWEHHTDQLREPTLSEPAVYRRFAPGIWWWTAQPLILETWVAMVQLNKKQRGLIFLFNGPNCWSNPQP